MALSVDVTRIKFALAIMGLVIFVAGVRLEDSRLRFIGIGFFVAAWLLRFVKTRPPRNQSQDQSRDQ
jgi:hypothetical protein